MPEIHLVLALYYLVNLLCMLGAWRLRYTEYSMKVWDSDEWAPLIIFSFMPIVPQILWIRYNFHFNWKQYLFSDLNDLRQVRRDAQPKVSDDDI